MAKATSRADALLLVDGVGGGADAGFGQRQLHIVGGVPVPGQCGDDGAGRVVRFVHWLARKPVIRWVTGATDTDISSASAWYRVMHMFDEGAPRPKPLRNPHGPIFVGAAMDDGTYVEGRMVTFNVAAEEDADREMLLGAPLHFTMPLNTRRHHPRPGLGSLWCLPGSVVVEYANQLATEIDESR